MRMSALFGTTLREAPADASSAAAALLARAGYLRGPGNGPATWLPLGRRALARLDALVQAGGEALGAQEIAVAEGVDEGAALGTLCRTEVRSWRHLPRLLTVSRAVSRDYYFLDGDPAGLERTSAALNDSFLRVLQACGAAVVALDGSPGEMPTLAQMADDGDSVLVRCPGCGYVAQRDAARFARKTAGRREDPLPLSKVATPDCTTIDDLCRFLGLERGRTAKAVFRVADEERLVFAVVRGDRDLSEAKLGRTVGAARMRPATADEIRATGAVPGYASPIGLSPATLVVADEEVPGAANLAAGANEPGFHLLNTNIPRDYRPGIVADIAEIPEGAACARCGAVLSACRGICISSALLPGSRGVKRSGAAFQDRQGKGQPVHAAGVRFRLDRALEAIAASCRDDGGLRMPRVVSPFDVHVLSLGGSGTEAMLAAERLADELEEAGVRVLLDDREESPGVKFADADLIGVPLRVTLSARSLRAGGAEMKRRDAEERVVLPAADAAARIRRLLAGPAGTARLE
jgi:prolyl-tRNA synthetase